MRRTLVVCLVSLSVVVPLAYARAAFTGAAPEASMSVSTATLVPPSNVSAVVIECVPLATGTVRVSWTVTASAWADGYEVFRATKTGGPYSLIATVSGQSTASYDDPTVASSKTYYYVVTATKLLWRSVNSNEASVRNRPHCL